MQAHCRCKCVHYNAERCISTWYFLFSQILCEKSKHFIFILSEMAELTEFERGVIIGGWLFGHSERDIEVKTGHPKSTIHDTIERYRETGAGTSRPRSGRPPILTDRDKRHIVRIVRSNRQQSAKQLQHNFVQSSGTVASLSTVKRALHEAGYHSRVAARKPLISAKNRRDRMQWCKRHKEWTDEQWKKVIWSDESRFTLFRSDGRIRVWRLPKEKYDVDCVVPTVKHGGGGVMVWGCFTWESLGPLVRAEGTINSQKYIDIMKANLIPFMQGLEGEIVDYEYQQDNASVHTSKLTTTFFENSDINVMKWPGQSPDLNPIEHLWDELERRLRKRTPPPRSEDELAVFLEEEWEKIADTTFQKLILSMKSRVKAVKRARGYATKY
jgi:transposase